MPNYKSVLIVDDDSIALMLSERLIHIAGFAEKSISFDSALKALKWITDNFKDKIVLPDIILVDLHMPEMDGFTFLQKIEEMFSPGNAPDVFVLSSTVYIDDKKKLNQFSFVKKIIMKPLTIADFGTGEESTHHKNIYAPL
ncbi:MAG: response regulator [Chitinophagaceae bacterium]